jgi:uncharacterized protein with von Willebrand factor type A (vWA) domain
MRLALLGLILASCGPSARPAPAALPGASGEPAAAADERLALVVVVDRSGSMMGAKMEHAKEAITAALGELGADDMGAVIVFDSEPTTVVRLGGMRGREVGDAIAAITPGGGTNYLPALQESYTLLTAVEVPKKHVIFLSDGQAPYDGIAELAAEYRGAGITISTVALGEADEKLLQMIAEGGAGRFWRVAEADQMAAIFVEDVRKARQ